MRMRTAILACAAALGATATITDAAPLGAQVPTVQEYYSVTLAPRGWLGIVFTSEAKNINGESTSAVVITEVSDNSPAKRAGVQAGDTILRVNDFRASAQLIGSLGSSLEPGDTVRFVVRRGSGERTLTIIVGERPKGDTFALTTRPGVRMLTIDPDSVRGRVHLFVDSMVASLDTSRINGVFRFDTTFAKSMRFDTLRSFHALTGDSMFFHSLPGQMFQYRLSLDSATNKFHGLVRDSMVDVFRLMPSVTEGLSRTLTTSGYLFQSNAFGGAGLAELNSGLQEYFKADHGVLVLNVPAGSPAARAGLEPGDVVTAVNGQNVSTIAEFLDAAAKAGATAPIRFKVVRHGKETNVELRRDAKPRGN